MNHWTLFSYLTISLAKAEHWERAHTKTSSFNMGLAAEVEEPTRNGTSPQLGTAPRWEQDFAAFHFSLTESLCHPFLSDSILQDMGWRLLT